MPAWVPSNRRVTFLWGKAMEFGKPATTLDQQISLLRSRGMRVDDTDRARHYLQHINYYRLTAYWLPFEANHATHQFQPGTTFEEVVNLYVFDREFRLLLLDAIERIEVSVRTHWAYYMAHQYGPHAHLDSRVSTSAVAHAKNLSNLDREVRRSREDFIEHYHNTYSEPELPPIWSVCEVMSFGTLSHWLGQLYRGDRRRIAVHYNLPESVFKSVIHHLNYVRNLCAHHSRIWNRRLTITMSLPRTRPQEFVENVNRDRPRNIYNTLAALGYLLEIVSPGNTWRSKVLQLLEGFAIDPHEMGFPEDYRARTLWREGSSVSESGCDAQ